MYSGRTVFAQLLGYVPFEHFKYLALKLKSNHGTQSFTAWSHFVCMAYAQFTRREGLRDLVVCLNSQRAKLYHAGIKHAVSRATLADANEKRGCQLFELLGQRLIEMASALHKDTDIGLGLKEPLYAMDSTTIDLCLKLFPWADFRQTKAAVKAHTVIDLRGAIPVMVTITTGKIHDINLLDTLQLPVGSTVVLDRGYVDFGRLYALIQREMNFVVRAKDNMRYEVVIDTPHDPSSGVRADQVIRMVTIRSKNSYPEVLRRVAFYDEKSQLDLVFLTNRLDLSAVTIAAIYKQRWQIELFFKWLKQNLVVKHFFGNSVNAVKTQIWIAICTYLITVIAHRQVTQKITLRNFMHLAEVNMFEKITLAQMVANALEGDEAQALARQEEMF